VSDHLPSDQLERYRSRTLTPAELLAAHGHLAICEACRGRLRKVERSDAAFSDLRAQLDVGDAEALHLPYEELSLHVDGALDDVAREVVDSHLAICPRCLSDVEDLRAFRSEMAARPDAEPAAPSRVLRFPRPPLRWILPAAGAAAATVIIAWLVTRSPGSEAVRSTQVETGPSAIRVTLNDGGRRVTLDRDGRVEGLPGLSPDVEAAVRAALDHQRVDTPPLLAGLIGARGTLLGPADGAAFSLSSPVGTVVEADRPTLRWHALPGAERHSVAVFDSDLRPVAHSPRLRRTEWRVPKPLARGRTYSWQVTATKDGKEVLAPDAAGAEARFHVLSGAEAEAVAKTRREHAGSHLVLGVVYARAGLLDDAERELRALAQANPDSRVAKGVLQRIESLRRPPSGGRAR
jgi:anti-sigma factor RsiW